MRALLLLQDEETGSYPGKEFELKRLPAIGEHLSLGTGKMGTRMYLVQFINHILADEAEWEVEIWAKPVDRKMVLQSFVVEGDAYIRGRLSSKNNG